MAQNRQLLIQNQDGGWDFIYDPSSSVAEYKRPLSDTTNSSFPNQFGLHALAMIDAYSVTKTANNYFSAKRTADALMSKTITRSARVYATDVEFLAKAEVVMGFEHYRTQALAGLEAEREYCAAMHILANVNPSEAQIAAIPTPWPELSDAQRVAALRARLVAYGRNAGLRAFDFNSRIKAALLLGYVQYALEIARVVAQDVEQIEISGNYYLLGLANTISALIPFKATEVIFEDVIEGAYGKLSVQQQDDGLFAGNLQDTAFIVEALTGVEAVQPLKKLVERLLQDQLPSGGYNYGGIEFVEAQSELLSALSRVWTEYSPRSVAAESKSFRNKLRVSRFEETIAMPFI